MSITRFVLQDITLARITLVLVSKTGSWLVLVYFSSMAIPMLFINTMRLYQLANTKKLENISRIYLQSAKKLVTTEMEKPPLTENLELYQSVGEYDNARENLERSLVTCNQQRKIGDRNGEASCHLHFGTLYLSFNQYKKAGEYLEKSIAILKETCDKETFCYGRPWNCLCMHYYVLQG